MRRCRRSITLRLALFQAHPDYEDIFDATVDFRVPLSEFGSKVSAFGP
jgi:hypothetical protein